MTTTEKIKVTVTTEEIKEIEISFPYYVQDGCTVIKFFDRRKGIMVTDYPFSKSVQWMDMPESWITYESTTEAVFNKVFDKVMNFLIKHK